ncbi:MAG: serine hydrolase domain-containing protein [Bacillota bacterium]
MMSNCIWKKEFLTYAGEIVSAHQIPGLAFGVARDGEVLETGGIGFRNLEEELPTGDDTVYGIGSITKSFTSLAIMQLQERGLLTVRNPVRKWLPDFRLPGDADPKEITLHHFMTHTSGLPPLQSLFNAMARSMKGDPSVEEYRKDAPDLEPIDTYEELMDFIAELDFEPFGPPGRFFSYSNDAYALLGAVIERASGQSYSSYLEENILKPLQMNHTTIETGKLEDFDKVTELYATTEKHGKQVVYHAPGWWEFPAMEAAGRLMSTVSDLLRYLEVYRCLGKVNGERIASEESIRQMMHPHASVSYPPNSHYGYGLSIQTDYHGVTLVGHGGGIKGVSADILLAVEEDITAAVLSNLAGVPSSSVTLGAVNTLKGLPANTRRHEHSEYGASPEQLARFSGSYKSGEGASIDLYMAGDRLFADLRDKTYAARPVAEDVVVIAPGGSEMAIQAMTDGQGQVWAISSGYRIIPRTEKKEDDDGED